MKSEREKLVNKVSEAIEQETGIAGVRLKCYFNGFAYFVKPGTKPIVEGFDDYSVWCGTLAELSVKEWVSEFKERLPAVDA